MKIENLKEDQKILFNDRKTPLTVSEVTEDGVWVEGPNGGEYLLYEDDGTPLVSKNERKRYSSYVENLRKVGKWKRDGSGWKHSKTGAKITVEETETGNFEIVSENIEPDIDQPTYGYLNEEAALEDAEKFVAKHPEGQA